MGSGGRPGGGEGTRGERSSALGPAKRSQGTGRTGSPTEGNKWEVA